MTWQEPVIKVSRDFIARNTLWKVTILFSLVAISIHIETSTFICRANQWNGFYMRMTSVMKELRYPWLYRPSLTSAIIISSKALDVTNEVLRKIFSWIMKSVKKDKDRKKAFCVTRKCHKMNLIIPKNNQSSFGNKLLRFVACYLCFLPRRYFCLLFKNLFVPNKAPTIQLFAGIDNGFKLTVFFYAYINTFTMNVTLKI